ncbi:hypothetical protein SAY87_022196 [Trapa incisa]|uniref:CASP-like protein n=2 Tax=Trapa TaxID=22665 RepID=A0AAN7RHX5_TRANT|nr:hypothetical protein SAY87_022196 [Trapa incisa]KAK4803600.1 hypothetical protein SAY86_003417 [Trapa natans]
MEESRSSSSKYETAEISIESLRRGEEGGEEKLMNGRTETLLRLVPMGLCVAALVIMLKDSQSNDYGSVSYSDLGGFRYLVHANGICAGYSLLSAVLVAVPRPSTMSRAWTFFLLDQMLTYVVLAAGAVSIELLYLAYKGDSSTTWSEACDSFNGFCRKAMTSAAITMVAVGFFVVLSLISSYKLFSRFDAPAPAPHHSSSRNGKSIEEAPGTRFNALYVEN